MPDAAPQSTTVPPAEVPGLAGLLSLATGVVVVAALYLGRAVLVPIMLAVLLSFVLAPLVSLLRHLKVGRVVSAVLAVAVALGVIAAAASLIGSQVASLAAGVPAYARQLDRKASGVRDSTLGQFSQAVGKVASQFRHAAGLDPSTERRSVRSASAARPLPVEVYEPAPAPLEVARRLLAPIVGPLETTAIVLVVAIFILSQREDLRDRLIRLFGSQDLHRTTVAMDEAAARLSRYFLSQFAINTVFGTIIGGGLFWIGVPSPWLWGILAGLLRFVPYIGPVLAAVPPLVLAAAVDPGWELVAWTAGLFALTEPAIGYGVEPLIYGHSTGLSPISVIVAAIFWTWLWGPIGLILSTPLTLCLVILGRHVQRLEFLDVLLGDRPALTPVESFYQRMLAGDPDEVLEQAELLLRDRPLSTYYDEVAVKALALAAADAARGSLSPAQLERVERAVLTLIADLDAHNDNRNPRPPAADSAQLPLSLAEQAVPRRRRGPPKVEAPSNAWGGPGAVLCIAGRGPLDAAVAAMLAQLLGKHGIGATVVPNSELTRERIAGFDPGAARLAVLCQLSATAGQAGLRPFVRRLRERLERRPLLVGLWSGPDAREAGADLALPTLAALIEAVESEAAVAALAGQAEAALAGQAAAAFAGQAEAAFAAGRPTPV